MFPFSNRFTRRLCITVVAGLTATALSALPAFSADNGTVNASVVAGAAPCITISSPPNGSPVNFGTLPFSTGNTPARTSGTPDITATNCGTSSETFLAKGTNATGSGPTPATWSLESLPLANCSATLNTYNLMLLGPNNTDTFLDDLANASLGSVLANSGLTRTPRIVMPCSGSNGSSQTMTMSFVFTATIP